MMLFLCNQCSSEGDNTSEVLLFANVDSKTYCKNNC